ncbi:MAG: AbrB/MazE/SpoVT family DNA-binding domain-containing protein [Nitrospiraceae bacterium]|nr:AbrB/MazE/SpoVT family DNA-binding domain-containing protein [Nitrospiraceae bacterium]
MTALAKVTSKGQITLPKEVRDLLRIRTGSIVVFEKEDEKLVVKAAKTLQDFKGFLKGRQGRADFEEMREKAKEYIGKKGARRG